ncbi:MAG TPA: hypothetical protein EYQ75_23805 [Planctomycetaceae bacterium]|nr:hypothetical protein [Planctomycetaceae bacterium]
MLASHPSRYGSLNIRFPRRAVIASAILVLAVSVFAVSSADARYRRPQLEQVPVERLAKNLEERLKQELKKDEEVVFRLNLARLHAMAFALKTDKTQALVGKLERGAWLGYEPKHVPFQAKDTDDAAVLAAADKQLLLAIVEYKKLLKLAPGDLTGRLGFAWCLEQEGNTNQAIVEYRKVIEEGWAKESKIQRAGLGWHSLVAEAGEYLTPLLDAKADADEIASIRTRTEKLRRIPRPVTPIAIPLAEDVPFEAIEQLEAWVAFDADGTGVKDWSWITPKAGWLVHIPQKGQVDSAVQMFGSVTWWLFWEHGYQALATLDDDGDGEVAGDELRRLGVWHDRNSNGLCESGELQSLAKYGIVALSCQSQTMNARDDRMVYSPDGVRFADGTVRPSYDVVLQPGK